VDVPVSNVGQVIHRLEKILCFSSVAPWFYLDDVTSVPFQILRNFLPVIPTLTLNNRGVQLGWASAVASQ
jgi:hypothetical protein